MNDTPPIPAKRGRADATANRARIIAAAQAVFAARGLDAEMREIAERADVAVGTLYRHFVDRDDLLRAVFTAMSAEVLARLETAAAIDDPRDAVRALMRALGAIHERFQATVALMHDPRLEKRVLGGSGDRHEWLTRMRTVVGTVVARGIRLGVFRPDIDAQVAASALMGAVFAFEPLLPERGYDTSADALADFYLASLGAR